MGGFDSLGQLARILKGGRMDEGLKFQRKPRIKSAKTLENYRRAHPCCELCGSTNSMGINAGGVHHIRGRGQQGGDDPANLITLCGFHHTEVHAGRISGEYLLKCKAIPLRLDQEAGGC